MNNNEDELRNGVADLHLHTTASDGTSTVGERVEQARKRNLDAISITDHDCIPEEMGEAAYKKGSVEVITGVEIKSEVVNNKVEILGYYVDPENPVLNRVLREVRQYREDRNRKLVERLVKATGVDITYGELCNSTNGQLGRPHFARHLVKRGIVTSVSEAFDEYLGRDGKCYVSMEKVDHERVISAIHSSGGVASLAHPGRIRSDNVSGIVEEIVSSGLNGVEVKYPYGEVSDGDFSQHVKHAKEIASKYNLLSTGGSDCHGKGSDKFRIGDVRISKKDLAKIKKAAESV